jgi:hypothetical protein
MTRARVALLLMVGMAAAACVAAPEKPRVRNAIYPRPAAQVQKAVAEALLMMGFEMKKSGPTYIEALKPRKVVGPVDTGGDTVGVWIDRLGPSRTGIRVSTTRSVLGVGVPAQKHYEEDILYELEELLGRRE